MQIQVVIKAFIKKPPGFKTTESSSVQGHISAGWRTLLEKALSSESSKRRQKKMMKRNRNLQDNFRKGHKEMFLRAHNNITGQHHKQFIHQIGMYTKASKFQKEYDKVIK